MNIVAFMIIWSSTICVTCMAMHATGLGRPNCEPTAEGYVWFYITLFGCSSLSVILFAVGLGLILSACRLINPKAKRG